MPFMEEWTRILNNVVSRESLLAQKEKETKYSQEIQQFTDTPI